VHLEEDERQKRKEVVTAHSGMTEVYRFLCGRRGNGRRGDRSREGGSWGDRGRVGGGETEREVEVGETERERWELGRQREKWRRGDRERWEERRQRK